MADPDRPLDHGSNAAPATTGGSNTDPEKPKDFWDKLDATSGLLTFISSLVIAAAGTFFTLIFKATEERVAELTISEKMIPHLTKGDRETEAALALMATLSNAEVAAKMAELFGGKGTIEAMKRLATSAPTEAGRNAAKKALDTLSNQGTVEEARAAIAARAAVTAAAAAPSAPTEQSFVVQSGPKLSGVMKAFSEPYELCGNAPPGYKIKSSDFRLVGDRSCGAWSECTETKKTDAQVCWQFRLQGHDELPYPGQRTSEGVLRVTAVHAP